MGKKDKYYECPECGIQFQGTLDDLKIKCPKCDTVIFDVTLEMARTFVKRLEETIKKEMLFNSADKQLIDKKLKALANKFPLLMKYDFKLVGNKMHAKFYFKNDVMIKSCIS